MNIILSQAPACMEHKIQLLEKASNNEAVLSAVKGIDQLTQTIRITISRLVHPNNSEVIDAVESMRTALSSISEVAASKGLTEESIAGYIQSIKHRIEVLS